MIKSLTVLCAVAVSAGLVFAAPAGAKTLKECNAEWKTKKEANDTGGQKYADFRKECLATAAEAPEAPAAPAPKTTAAPAPKSPAPAPKSAEAPAAEPAAPSGPAVFPVAINPKYANESAGKARRETCRDQYRENKVNNANGGLKWTEKGGGYYSECNKRLKS
jgi:hypothetical protein